MSSTRRSLRLGAGWNAGWSAGWGAVWLGLLLLGLGLVGCADAIPAVAQPAAERQAVEQAVEQAAPSERATAPATDPPPAEPQRADREQAAAQDAAEASAPSEPETPETIDRLVWSDEPLALTGSRGRFQSWRDRQAQDARINNVLRAEQAWCEADAGVAELRALLTLEDPAGLLAAVESPATDEELVWLTEAAEITARVRGETLLELPAVRIIDRWDLRRLGCIPEFISDWLSSPTVIEHTAALDRFARLLTPLSTDFEAGETLGIWVPLIGGAFHPGSPGSRQVTLIGSRPLSQQALEVAVHEFAHALQNQRLDASLWDAFGSGSSDSRTALQWLLEGEATAVTDAALESAEMQALRASLEWGAGTVLRRHDPLFANALRYNRLANSGAGESPYRDGQLFIEQVRGEGGWAAVDALFLEPPATMEQVLHRGKLEAREAPIVLRDRQRLDEAVAAVGAVGAVAAVEADWQAPVINRLGEARLRRFLRETLGARSEAAALAAAGWGNDELSVWTSAAADGPTLAVWQLVFDSAAHHQEAWVTLALWLSAHSEGEARAARNAPVLGWDGPAGVVRLLQQGQSLWLLAASNAARGDALALNILAFPAQDYWPAE